MLEQGYTWYEN